ncbi:Ribonuclease H-like domain containing protein [Trema orientale]|uniref:Ribonuclease H-like domain containing protein n=1 Tax=Trema orientale TaxID=63057 RepID=A0A2P5F0R2_TREOI|nr:Ribonuclease H-like domain containing protein [Trema orientale]
MLFQQGERLGQVFGGTRMQCCLCSEAPDLISHLFFQCPFTISIWFGSKWQVRTDSLPNLDGRELVSWILSTPQLAHCDTEVKRQFTLFGAVVCDKVWKARNGVFYNGDNADPRIVLSQVNTVIAEFTSVENQLVGDSNHVGSLESTNLQRHNLSINGVRIYVDAAFKNGRGTAAIVSRDSNNRILDLVTDSFEASSPLEAEGHALKMGIQLCQGRNWEECSIFSDCQVWVKAVERRKVHTWQLAWLCLSVFNLLSTVHVNVYWTPRVCNKSAHALANWAFRLNLSGPLSI